MRALLLPLLLFSAGCGVTNVLPPPPEPTYTIETRRTWYVEREVPRTEQRLRIWEDGREEPHGQEKRWYRTGAPQWERHFRDGQPTGSRPSATRPEKWVCLARGSGWNRQP